MNNTDTINLLKETDKGVQMSILSFDQLLEKVSEPSLKMLLTESRDDHKRLKNEVENLLTALGSSKDEPPMMAKTMAWMETNIKMGMEYNDRAIADIITKGCDMGSRNLQKYINQYDTCDLSAENTAKKLIQLEEDLSDALKVYL